MLSAGDTSRVKDGARRDVERDDDLTEAGGGCSAAGPGCSTPPKFWFTLTTTFSDSEDDEEDELDELDDDLRDLDAAW